MKQYY